MEDLFWIFFIIFFIVGPILERIRKGGAGQRPPPRRPLPGQRQGQQRLPQQRGLPTEDATQATAESSDESATELLPADLWEMLTGQRPSHGEPMSTGPRRRAPESALEIEPEDALVTRPVPEEQRRQQPVPPSRDTRAELEALERRRQREIAARKVERAQREAVSLEVPVREAVSLERTPRSEPIRHAAFHRKLDELAPAARVIGDAEAVFHVDRMKRSELQRAILLKEILGEPKGLE